MHILSNKYRKTYCSSSLFIGSFILTRAHGTIPFHDYSTISPGINYLFISSEKVETGSQSNDFSRKPD